MWHIFLIITLTTGNVEVHHLEKYDYKNQEECMKMAPTIGRYYVKEKVDADIKLVQPRCTDEKVNNQGT